MKNAKLTDKERKIVDAEYKKHKNDGVRQNDTKSATNQNR